MMAHPFVNSSLNLVYRSLVNQPPLPDGVQEEFDRLNGVWPERLLDTESLVSYERRTKRDGSQWYNDVKEPEFTIVSYKWGLWVVEDGPRLPIKGINWEPPAIDQKHFTVDEQIAMLKQLGRSCRFVWIDGADLRYDPNTHTLYTFLTTAQVRDMSVYG